LVSPRSVFAQESGATPAALTKATTSQTRKEFRTEVEEALGYTEAATPGGTFIDSEVTDIQTIHPLLADDGPSLSVVGLLYDSLLGSDVRTGQPAPTGLADYWEIAEDGRTYTFHLNQDAKWHDGTDITTDDVQFSFDALANQEVGSSYTQSFLEATESWRVIDEHTFEVVAREPLFTFLFDLVTWIIPKHIWESVPVADWRTDPGATGQDPARVVGSGAWKFGEWLQGESITLVRNDNYFQKVPYIDSYVIRIWPDQTSVINALLNGELDSAGLEPGDVETVEATEGLVVAIYPTRGFTFYGTNMDPEKTRLFLDRPVRQALLHGLDRESIVNDIWLGYAEVAQGTQPVISYAYAPDRITTKYDYDPEKAKALLAEAGWTDSDGDGIVDKDGQPFAFELMYNTGSPTVDQLIAYMQDAWRAIGVDMMPRAVEFSALSETITGDHNFDVVLLAFSWDPTFIQDAMFGCEQYEGGFNMVRYCNERVDELNAQAKRTFDEEARRELLIEATNLVNEDLPVAVMHFGKARAGFSDRLQNFEPGPWGVDLTYVWIQQ
ncbi:MAG TPA: ABC transporter substrate-binding protein, partial [Actinomycetota bacterium]|nr:ABC transporter substrate-binding protein [Actinomycetota bacterium]